MLFVFFMRLRYAQMMSLARRVKEVDDVFAFFLLLSVAVGFVSIAVLSFFGVEDDEATVGNDSAVAITDVFASSAERGR